MVEEKNLDLFKGMVYAAASNLATSLKVEFAGSEKPIIGKGQRMELKNKYLESFSVVEAQMYRLFDVKKPSDDWLQENRSAVLEECDPNKNTAESISWAVHSAVTHAEAQARPLICECAPLRLRASASSVCATPALQGRAAAAARREEESAPRTKSRKTKLKMAKSSPQAPPAPRRVVRKLKSAALSMSPMKHGKVKEEVVKEEVGLFKKAAKGDLTPKERAMMMAALSHDLKKMGIDNVKPEVEIKEENSGKKVRCPCHAAA